LTFVWNIFALDTNKDRRILTGIIEESYFSKVELFDIHYSIFNIRYSVFMAFPLQNWNKQTVYSTDTTIH